MAHGLSLTLARITPPAPVVVSEQPYANRAARRHVTVTTRRNGRALVTVPREQRQPALNVPYRSVA